MNTPTISVIVPIYNVDMYLEQCLTSLVRQTFEDIEIICVNDGSTDNSPSIANSFASRYAQISVINKENGGYGSAVNLGLLTASGEYIGIVEPDDYVSEDMYETLYSSALRANYPEIVKAGYWDLFEGESPKIKCQLGMRLDDCTVFTVNEHPEILRIHPSVWSCIYHREFLKSHNIHMIEAKGAGWVDNPFFYETICQAKSICWVNKPLYYYRQYSNNSSSALKDCSIPIARMNEIFDFLDEKKIQNTAIIKEAYSRAFLYVRKIENNPNLTISNKTAIKCLIRRMNRRLVAELKADDVDTYNRHCKKHRRILQPVSLRLKAKFKQKFGNTSFYRLVKNVYILTKYCKNEGIAATYRKIVQHMRKIPVLPRKKGLRVLFIPSDNSRTSGAFLSMVTLNVILREKYNVDTFVVLPNPGNGEELLRKNNIPYTLIESKDWVIPIGRVRDTSCEAEISRKKAFNEKAVRTLAKMISVNHFDIVHINTTYSYVGAIAALSTGVPFVWHLREFLEEDQGNTLWDRTQGNQLISKATKVIAISNSIAKKYQGIIDDTKLVCIQNGIDHNKFYAPSKTILNNRCARFVFVGGFEYYKGQIEFAQACAKIDTSKYDFKVYFVGTGKKEVRDKVERIFTEAGMADRITYCGYKENVNDYLKEADISFTCARSEAFGRTTVEAMLSGNLVIGANTAGTKELIKDNITGILYSQGDPADLRKRICWALENRNEARKIAENGRNYMYNNMTAEKNADKIYALYKGII